MCTHWWEIAEDTLDCFSVGDLFHILDRQLHQFITDIVKVHYNNVHATILHECLCFRLCCDAAATVDFDSAQKHQKGNSWQCQELPSGTKKKPTTQELVME